MHHELPAIGGTGTQRRAETHAPYDAHPGHPFVAMGLINGRRSRTLRSPTSTRSPLYQYHISQPHHETYVRPHHQVIDRLERYQFEEHLFRLLLTTAQSMSSCCARGRFCSISLVLETRMIADMEMLLRQSQRHDA